MHYLALHGIETRRKVFCGRTQGLSDALTAAGADAHAKMIIDGRPHDPLELAELSDVPRVGERRTDFQNKLSDHEPLPDGLAQALLADGLRPLAEYLAQGKPIMFPGDC